MTPEQLQSLYIESLLTGFADFKKRRYSTADLEQIAQRRNIDLTTTETLFIQQTAIN